MIVTSKNGKTRVKVYPHEGDNERCFTGMNLEDGDISSLWLKSNFNFEENPMTDDLESRSTLTTKRGLS